MKFALTPTCLFQIWIPKWQKEMCSKNTRPLTLKFPSTPPPGALPTLWPTPIPCPILFHAVVGLIDLALRRRPPWHCYYYYLFISYFCLCLGGMWIFLNVTSYSKNGGGTIISSPPPRFPLCIA